MRPIGHRLGRRGAHTLEFALLAPVLVALLVAVMEFGWYFSRQVAVTTAVRDAARVGAMTPRTSPEPADEVAEEALIDSLVAQGYSGEVKLDVGLYGVAPGVTLRVGVELPHRGLTGFVPVPSTLQSLTSIRIEDQPQ